MSLPDNQWVQDRKIAFCPTLSSLGIPRLIIECHKCSRYFAACCLHGSFGEDLYKHERGPCQHARLVFTDGACSNNGYAHAKAGLGVAIGGDRGFYDYSWSIPVDDSNDPNAPRTNQRAELLAAIEGLMRLEDAYELEALVGHEEDSKTFARRHPGSHRATYIVVTDSEYVVKGITEWFPSWRRRAWRTSGGKSPTNLDLFIKLDDCVTRLEKDHVVVGFWHVPRALNHQADSLAKKAVNMM